jgi:uncharacterized membrane protein YgcG
MKKTLLFAVLLIFSSIKIFAQAHLKDVQVTSVWAPANVKIDGNITEWEDSFQAYNKTTKLFYTLSNNEKYLFLALTCTDAGNNTKIAAGGITLTINTAGKKKDKDAFILGYPVITRAGGRGVRGNRRPQTDGVDTAAVAAARKQFITSSKEIKVFGFKDIADTLISIYNEYGIKTGIGYDALGNYSYELAIPLKLLGISADNAKEIAYNIKVNGLLVNTGAGVRNNNGGDNSGGFGGGGFGGGNGGGGRGGSGGSGRGGDGGGRINFVTSNIDFQDLTNPTDFWGKYTLAKK